MPTVITHALLPLIGAAAVPRARLSSRLVAVGMVAAMLPDADIVGRYFGVPHTADFGHRGATHTLMFALLLAAMAALAAPLIREGRMRVFMFVLLSTLFHPLADMLNDGGKGIMMFWPFDHERFKFLVHPVRVAPVGLQGFESGSIWPVFGSELLWLILPATALAAMSRVLGKRRLGRAAD